MKITKVDIYAMKADAGALISNVMGIRIYTDEGIYGDGEVAAVNWTWSSHGMLRDLAWRLIGRDPFANEVLWDEFKYRTFWGQNGGSFWYAGVSAIDIALWDIKSKALNIPLYQLLGGKRRDKVRCYASQLQFGWGNKMVPAIKIEDYIRNTEAALKDGYDAIKIDFLTWDEDGRFLNDLDRKGVLPNKYVDLVARRVAAVRETCGPTVDIIMENHSATDTQSAMNLAKAVEPYNIYFFEEPQTPVYYNNRTLFEKIDLPIAHGERLYGRWEYLPFFQDGSISVIQPDLGNCGGITEVKKICDMAHIFDVGVQIHTCSTHLLTPPSVVLEACIPNFVIHEQHVNTLYPELRELTTKHYDCVNGYLDVPDEPGIGNEWSEKFLTCADKIVVE